MADDSDWIVSNPAVLGGKPCIRGTRISVELILEILASGGTPTGILESYPNLEPEGVAAAVRYAADALRGDRIWDVKVPA